MALGACSSEDETPQFALNTFTPSECWFDQSGLQDYTIECGYVGVQETHGDPESPSLALAVAKVQRRDALPQGTPLIWLEGGPGGPSTPRVPLFLGAFGEALTQDNALVFFDQRGVANSWPRLACSVNQEAETLEQLWQSCAADFERRGTNLNAYNSVESAADVDVIRQALGFDTVRIYGGSYGSLLAQHVLRDFPEHIESAVLDGIVPMGQNSLAQSARNRDDTWSALFESCAQDDICALGYADLETRFLRVIDELKQEPLRITASFAGGQTQLVEITATDLAITLGSDAMIFGDAARRIPQFIEWIERAPDDAEAAQALVNNLVSNSSSQQQSSASITTEMHVAVRCTELGRFASLTADATEVRPELFDLFEPRNVLYTTACPVLDLAPLRDSSVSLPMGIDVPTLILSGRFDPRTPPGNAAEIVGNFNNVFEYVLPKGGHVVIGQSRCAQDMVANFLRNPGVSPREACLDDDDIRFVTGL